MKGWIPAIDLSGLLRAGMTNGAWLGCLLLVLSATGARSQDPGSAFDTANKLYEEGKFVEAASAYEKLIQSGQTSAAVYFNLGNAFFKSGQLGRAVAAYRSTAEITPRDPDVRGNLAFARNQVQGPTQRVDRWRQFLSKMTLNEWTLLASGALWIWLLLLGTLQLRPRWVLALRGYVLGLAVAVVVLGGCLCAALYENRFSHIAIVIRRDVPVHHGPLEESQNAFVAHDGAEFQVLDQKDDWLQVSAGSGRIGWLRRDQALLAPGI